MPVSSPEDVVNQALMLLGYPRRIGDLYDGSPAAVGALEVYAQTRDALLTMRQPDWAKRDATLTLSKTAPDDYLVDWTTAAPPLPWRFEYAAPEDCLVPLQVKPQMLTVYQWRPRYQAFRAARSADAYVILTNTPDAILTYISRFVPPEMWHEEFIEEMVGGLARKLQTAAPVWLREITPQMVDAPVAGAHSAPRLPDAPVARATPAPTLPRAPQIDQRQNAPTLPRAPQIDQRQNAPYLPTAPEPEPLVTAPRLAEPPQIDRRQSPPILPPVEQVGPERSQIAPRIDTPSYDPTPVPLRAPRYDEATGEAVPPSRLAEVPAPPNLEQPRRTNEEAELIRRIQEGLKNANEA